MRTQGTLSVLLALFAQACAGEAIQVEVPGIAKPAWASETGQDQYGTWADLHAGRVVQRMRLIKAGTFLMGSPLSEADRDTEEAPHQVTLTMDYWLGDSEVTQWLWQQVMSDNPSQFKGDDNRPVERVSWDDCQRFIVRLNRRVSGGSFMLPTEAQWEYACRAGSTTPFSFGTTITPEQVNYDGEYPYGGADKGRYRKQTVVVKSLPANAWGLFEMHGNVREWCSDWHGDYPANAVVDPTGPASGSSRVYRNGGWNSNGSFCRAAFRGRFVPGRQNSSLGFRLASTVQSGP